MKKIGFVTDESAMQHLGNQLAKISNSLKEGLVIYLSGDLGVGKTTLVRGFLRGLGYKNKVKSPTYSIVEIYEIANKLIYHFDLYRIHEPLELESMGIRDYFQKEAIIFVEWPQRATLLLPEADLNCYIQLHDQGRLIIFNGQSKLGDAVLEKLV